jgi:hypothetical protein
MDLCSLADDPLNSSLSQSPILQTHKKPRLDRLCPSRALQRPKTTECSGQVCSRAKNYLLAGGRRAQDVEKEKYLMALSVTAIKARVSPVNGPRQPSI